MHDYHLRERELLEEVHREFMLDPAISLSTKFHAAQAVEDYRWIDTFLNDPAYRNQRERAARQEVSNTLYGEFAARLIATSNVSAWLKKRGRTPEVVLLHRGHEIGMSISFRIPGKDENVPLAWDMRPYKAGYGTAPGRKQFEVRNNAATFLKTDKGQYWGQDIHGEPLPIGGSYFQALSDPTETALDVYLRERAEGASTLDSARAANTARFEPEHSYAPTGVEFRCWCRLTLRPRWSALLNNIERSLKPGHVRVENKRIVAAIPVH